MQACEQGALEIGAEDGMLHLPAVTALPDEGEPGCLRDLVYQRIGDVQFPDLLLEIDAPCNYSEALLGHLAHDTVDTLDLGAFHARYDKGGPRSYRSRPRAMP